MDIEKAINSISKRANTWALQRWKPPEKFVRIVMHEDSRSSVTIAERTSDTFEMGIGVHEDLAFSTFLLIVETDRFSEQAISRVNTYV